MSALKTAVLELVKKGVKVQNKIKTAIPGSTQAEVLTALGELVNDGELSVTNDRARGNTYAINFRQALPPLEEGAPTVSPTPDDFPENEIVGDKEAEMPTEEEIEEAKELWEKSKASTSTVVPPVVNVNPPNVNNVTADKVVKQPTANSKK